VLLQRTEQTLSEERSLLERVEPDWEDRAANLTAALVLDRMSDVELAQLRRIQVALDRLDHGTYGRCVQCRQSIERARLQVLPETDRCALCALAS
jgi:RNA polymerase-binding transcription factor DksA